MDKLELELGMKVVPAAGRLVESLRVALLTSDEVEPALGLALDRLHGKAIALAEEIVKFKNRIEAN